MHSISHLSTLQHPFAVFTGPLDKWTTPDTTSLNLALMHSLNSNPRSFLSEAQISILLLVLHPHHDPHTQPPNLFFLPILAYHMPLSLPLFIVLIAVIFSLVMSLSVHDRMWEANAVSDNLPHHSLFCLAM